MWVHFKSHHSNLVMDYSNSVGGCIVVCRPLPDSISLITMLLLQELARPTAQHLPVLLAKLIAIVSDDIQGIFVGDKSGIHIDL